MRTFDALTARGKLRRLAALARIAIQQWPVDVMSVRLLTEHTNAIFRVDARDGQRYVLRVCAPGEHSRAERMLEAQWMASLAGMRARVPQPVALRAGGYVASVAHPGVDHPRDCMLFTWVPGRPIKNTPAHLALVGESLAKLHQAALSFQLPQGAQPMRWDTAFYWVHEPTVVYDPTLGIFTEAQRAAFRAAEADVNATIARLHASTQFPPRLLHGDLHNDNAHLYRGELWVIDFEDVVWGVPAQDIAVALYRARYGDAYGETLRAFRAAYERIAPWPIGDDRDLETLFVARALMFLNYCANNRGDSEMRAVIDKLIPRIETADRAGQLASIPFVSCSTSI